LADTLHYALDEFADALIFLHPKNAQLYHELQAHKGGLDIIAIESIVRFTNSLHYVLQHPLRILFEDALPDEILLLNAA
jgi:hypothetical protein